MAALLCWVKCMSAYRQQSTAGRCITYMYWPGGVIVRIWSVEICELDCLPPEVISNQDGAVSICKQVSSRIVKIVTHCGRYTRLKIDFLAGKNWQVAAFWGDCLLETLDSENVMGNWFCDRKLRSTGHSVDPRDRVSLYVISVCSER